MKPKPTVRKENGAIPKSSLSNKEDSLHHAVKQLAYQDKYADKAIVRLFNALAKSLGVDFVLPEGISISRARSIVTTWCPQMYDITLDPNEFSCQYVLSQFFDRYISVEERQSVLPLLEVEAAKKFIRINEEGRNFDEYTFSDKRLIPLLDKMRYIIGEVLSDFSLLEIYENCEHGPNSTTGVDFSNSFLDVKDFDLSGPRATLQQFIHYLNLYNTDLKEALMNESDEFRSCINAWHLDGLNVDDCTVLSLVPKNFKALRTMCPEQTIPSFFGQAVGKAIAKRLQKINIDLPTQPLVHRALARLGSFYPELMIATVDWSQASDRIWIGLCEAVMSERKAPQYLDFIMNVCRCKYSTIAFDGIFGGAGDFCDYQALWVWLYQRKGTFQIETRLSKGRSKLIYYTARLTVETTMVGTMGNAITFPLQTLMFYAFLTACTELHADDRLDTGPSLPSANEYQPVSSFGDDGICDSRVLPEVSYFSALIGWKMNEGKSFGSGGFRESCGGDYYKGKGCRAIMMKRPPISPYTPQRSKILQAWAYIAANAANALLDDWGFTPYHIDRWLESFHADLLLGKICVVPPYYSDGSGLRVVDLVGPVYETYMREHQYPKLGVNGVSLGLNPEKYHLPWYSTMTGELVFWTLSNSPIDRRPAHEYSYYVRSLKSLGTTENMVYHNISFFELHKVEQSRLNGDGYNKYKECRLHKQVAGVLSWNQPNGYVNES